MSTHARIGALRILIVDPDPVMCSLTAFMLTSCGIRSFGKASSFNDALNGFLSGRFDMILAGCTRVDEEFDGFVATLRDPQKNSTPEVPIILYTALTTLPTILKAARAGVSLVLCRPMSAKSLGDHILGMISMPGRFEERDGVLRPAWPQRLIELLEPKPPQLVAVNRDGNGEEQLSTVAVRNSKAVIEI